MPAPFSIAEHAWQSPSHCVLQQTPSTQKPDWQLAPVAHAAPGPLSAVHVPALQ
jgi:hypothetical protein